MQHRVVDKMRRASALAAQVRNAIKPCIGFAQASAGMLYSSVTHRRRMVDDLAWVAMKDVASCDKPRGGACIL